MPKQKLTKILKWSAAGLLVAGLVLIAGLGITYAQGDATGGKEYDRINFWAGLGVAFIGLLAKFFGIIGEVIAGIIMPIVMQILDALLSDPNWVFSNDSPLKDIVTVSHGAALTLANGFLLLGLIVASVAIILRIGTGTYNIKKFLGSFVTMAILANVSLPIFMALLGMGDALFNSVDFLFVESTIGISRDTILVYLKDLANMHIPISLGVAGTILVLATMLISAWVLIKVTLLLIERTIFLFIMLVLAPLSFGMSVLPTTQKMASQWIENVIKWILAMPMTYAILALGVFVLQEIGGKGTTPGELSSFVTGLGSSIDIVGGGGIELSASPIHIAAATSVKDLLMFIIGLTIIYMAGTVPKMLKIGGAIAGLVESPGKLTGMGQKAWKTIADTATGKTPIGKFGKGVVGARWRETMAGWYDKNPVFGKAAQGLRRLEGWRSSLGKEWYSGILNPTGRKVKGESDEKLGITKARAAALSGRLMPLVQELDAEAKNRGAVDKEGKPITRWYGLSGMDQKSITKDNKELKAKASRVSDLQSSLAYMLRQITPKDLADFDPVDRMADDLDAAKPEEHEEGEWGDTIIRMGKLAGTIGPESDVAREAIKDLSDKIIDLTGLNPYKLGKGKRGRRATPASGGGEPAGGVEDMDADEAPDVPTEGELAYKRQDELAGGIADAKKDVRAQVKAEGTSEVSSKVVETVLATEAEDEEGNPKRFGEMLDAAIQEIKDIVGSENKDSAAQVAQTKLETKGFSAEEATQLAQLGKAATPADVDSLSTISGSVRGQNTTLSQLVQKVQGLQQESHQIESGLQRGAESRVADSGDEYQHYGAAINTTLEQQIAREAAKSAQSDPAIIRADIHQQTLNQVINFHQQAEQLVGAERSGAGPAAEQVSRVNLANEVFAFLKDLNIPPAAGQDEYRRDATPHQILSDIDTAHRVIELQFKTPAAGGAATKPPTQ
ncbi:hypothetical protein A2994_03320 [candidate division Kazan bacterium RIFCSPLOWO2_01_FULL_48_13]|uniref:Uncharacterized protein n=1 Tax=candidate division Kazan bacterium RIFCSPLOWO2_01_FULL_48_13 TaxID=1798539 RepID=A0A1F4PQ36_UNCK3|nr:MAG: hypothetical protein A2994_03320 [candidate division Kazan bacterium RIFCSPLOWO2_01_FULL_48_13]